MHTNQNFRPSQNIPHLNILAKSMATKTFLMRDFKQYRGIYLC